MVERAISSYNFFSVAKKKRKKVTNSIRRTEVRIQMYTAKVNRESVFVCGGDDHPTLTRREESMRIMAMVKARRTYMFFFFEKSVE